MATQVRAIESVTTPVTRHLFTIHDYQRMGEVGILDDDSRVELICGEIVEMTPIGDRHASAVARLADLFVGQLPGDVLAWIQNPIVLDDLSEPQPDFCLVKRREDFYAGGKPRPSEILLLIEVSDTTIGYDRNVKKRLYAISGIEEYWIVNLADETIELNLGPRDGAYTRQFILSRGESASPSAIAGMSFAVDDLLGPTVSV